MNYKAHIREVPDFPKPGILFYDITPLLNNPVCFRSIIDECIRHYQDAGITRVVGIESRGFILGSPLAYHLKAGFVPVRKPGKLPADVFEVNYNLEYGSTILWRFIVMRFKRESGCLWLMIFLPLGGRPGPPST